MVVEVVEEEHTHHQFQHHPQDLALVEQVEAVSEEREEIDPMVPRKMVNLVVLESPDMVAVAVEQLQLHQDLILPPQHIWEEMVVQELL
jgi:acyl CoA:acetate/3-ketoacid CoA transferase|tara:strand:+ start:453 stop:719 length:267 start_codon:yes stop_codon:yes gene_type:complete